MKFKYDYSVFEFEYHVRLVRLREVAEELALDIGTVLEGEEAVEEGLIDKVGTVRDALDRLYKMIDEKKTSESKKKR